MSTTVHQLYEEIWGRETPDFDERIKKSLSPRNSGILYRMLEDLKVGPEDVVLDIGCRDASRAIEIHRRLNCRVVAVDPIPLHERWTNEQIANAGLENQIRFALGAIEKIPLDDSSLQVVWCRDMLNHVDLPRGMAECFRVLKPAGAMLVYQTFATDRMEPKEARQIYEAMAIRPENMQSGYFEEVALQQGFQIVLQDQIGSEWREGWLENGETDALEDLLALSRMRRQEEALVREFGRERYEAANASSLWGIYQFLGKLCPTIYLLEKPA